VDVIYQDVSARDQAGILLANSRFLKKGGYAYVAIKSQSISVAKKPSEVYSDFFKEVAQRFEAVEKIDIAPYDQKHMFAVLKNRP
jgi:fibrillarin-like pre-rRNA processing protein